MRRLTVTGVVLVTAVTLWPAYRAAAGPVERISMEEGRSLATEGYNAAREKARLRPGASRRMEERFRTMVERRPRSPERTRSALERTRRVMARLMEVRDLARRGPRADVESLERSRQREQRAERRIRNRGLRFRWERIRRIRRPGL